MLLIKHMYVFYVWYQIHVYQKCGHHTDIKNQFLVELHRSLPIGVKRVPFDVGHGRTHQSAAENDGRRAWRGVVGGAVGT